MMMKAASFAPLLEEEIPTSFSPGCVDNADNTEQAGRTPHIRRLEAERNINLLKNSLHMSGLKINAALYDSPMSIVSTGSENTHPNKLPSTGSNSSTKKGLSVSSPLVKKALITASKSNSSSVSKGTKSKKLPGTPHASIAFPADTPMVDLVAPTPHTQGRPTTVKFSDSVGGPLATALPASAMSTPSGIASVNMSPESMMSLRSSPAAPLDSPSADEEKPQHTSPDKLWALLMGGSFVHSPSDNANTTTGSLEHDMYLEHSEEQEEVQEEEQEEEQQEEEVDYHQHHDDLQNEEDEGDDEEYVDQKSAEHNCSSLSQPSFDAQSIDAGSAKGYKASDNVDFTSSPQSTAADDDMSQVTSSPMTLSKFAQPQQQQEQKEQQKQHSSRKISPQSVSSRHTIRSKASLASCSPAAASVASTAHSVASQQMNSPIAHFQYSQSPSTAAAKPPRVPSPNQPAASVSAAVSPEQQPVACSRATSPNDMTTATAPVRASVKKTSPQATMATPPRPVLVSTACSPIQPEAFAVNVPITTTAPTQSESFVEETEESVDDAASIAHSEACSEQGTPMKPVNDSCDTSMSTVSSNSSPAVLCRRGGVAFGHGPRFTVQQRNAHNSFAITKSATRGIAMDSPHSSRSSAKNSPEKVPVHSLVGSATKPGLPRQEAASKVARKLPPSIPRSTKSSAAKVTTKNISPKSVSGVSRSSKRVKGDTHVESSLESSCNNSMVNSLASVCATETSAGLPSEASSQACLEALSETRSEAEVNIAQIGSASMCNVSIQCDSFLLAAGNVVAPPTPAALSTACPLASRSTYDCFEEGLDAALSMDGSHVHHSATLDYSIDTPERAKHTPPQHHIASSPVFMSYRKLHHDSDSEDDMLEMGLDELLAGSPQQASPIAKRHSFEESSCMAYPVLQKKTEWEHSFTAPPPQRANTPATAQSSSSAASKRLPRTTSSRKSKVSSALGSAKRINRFGDVEDHVVCVEDDKVENTVNESAQVSGWKHSIDFSALGQSALHASATAMTDIAVVPANLSVPSDAHSEVFDLSMTQSVATGVETTLTLDHKHHAGVTSDEQAMPEGPRLAFMPLKRDRNAVEDVKEVTFCSRPGEVTTVMLTFNNSRNKETRINSHAVSLRFEEYVTGANGQLQLLVPEVEEDGLTVESAAPPCSFEVSPAELKIPPGEDGILYVTFVPQAGVVGVYSGALKMRTKNKTHMMLLRGKAVNVTSHHNAGVEEGVVLPAASLCSSPIAATAAQQQQQQQSQANSKTPESELIQRLQKLNSSPTAAPAANTSSSHAKVIPQLELFPQSLLLQKSTYCNRYEANLKLELKNGEFSDISLVTSASFLKLSRSRVILSGGNQESVKVLLDERSPELVQLCNSVLSINPNGCTTAMAGYITVKTLNEGEYTLDIEAEKMSPAAVMPVVAAPQRTRSASTPRSVTSSRPPHAHSSQSLRPAGPTPRSERSRGSRSSPSKIITSSQSVSSVEGEQSVHTTTTRRSIAESRMIVTEEQCLSATAASLLMLRRGSVASPSAIVESPQSSRQSRSASASSKRSQSVPRSSPPSANSCATSDIRNFLRAEESNSGNNADDRVDEDVSDVTPVPRASVPTQAEKATVAAPQHLMEKKTGVYFRKNSLNYGAVAIGSLTRANVELCNASDAKMTVFLGDPCLPFVLLHNEVTIRPHSYICVPVRFLPVSEGQYMNELLAQTADGAFHTKIQLQRSAYA